MLYIYSFTSYSSWRRLLATNGALIHLLATHHTRDHVATFQENTVNRRVHAYLTEDLILNHYTPRYIRRSAT